MAGSAYTAYRLAKSNGVSDWACLRAVFGPIAVLILVLGAVNLVLFYLPMEMWM